MENTVTDTNLKNYGYKVKIPFLDGSESVSSAKNIFQAYIPSTLKKKPPGARLSSKKAALCVYKRGGNKSMTFLRMFESLPGYWDKKWISESQLVNFFKVAPYWITEKKGLIAFICKIDESQSINSEEYWKNLQVIYVDLGSPGFPVYDCDLISRFAWNTGYDLFLVIPEQELY